MKVTRPSRILLCDLGQVGGPLWASASRRLWHGQSAPGVAAVESRPPSREGTLASVRLPSGTWLSHAKPCLSPWQPNSAMPTLYLINLGLHPLLKGTQLGLLWGGGASCACQPLHLPQAWGPRSGLLPIRDIPDISARPALEMTWPPGASVLILPSLWAPPAGAMSPRWHGPG